MPRIVIPDDEPAVMVPSASFEKLRGHDVRAFSDRPSGPDELVRRIRDADVVINIRASSRFTREVVGQCSALRLISIWAPGLTTSISRRRKHAGLP